MNRKVFSLLLLVLMFRTVNAQPESQIVAADVEIVRELTFAQYPNYTLQLDLYRPAHAAQKLPVVIVIREGGWVHGDKETSAPMAAALARRGLAAVSIEYRGASEAVFPAYVYDVKAAIRFLRANAKIYNLDPDAIGAMGGSWGAYLAAFAGVTSGIPELEGSGGFGETSSRLAAVVGLSTPSYLAKFPETMERYLGESYASNPALWEFASVTTHVSKDSPPLMLIASEKDTTVPFEQSLLLARAYGEANAEIQIHLIPSVGHSFWNYNEPLEDQVAEFFHKHLDRP